MNQFPPSSTGPFAREEARAARRQPRIAALLAMIFSSLIGALIILAAGTDVPQITRAPGIIIPSGNYAQIETLEGGVVTQVHVEDGQIVDAGDLLVELRNPELIREHATLREQLAGAQDRLSNAQAVLEFLEHSWDIDRSAGPSIEAGLHMAAAELDLLAESQRIRAISIAHAAETIDLLETALELTEDRVDRQEIILARAVTLFDQGLTTIRAVQEEEDQLDALRAMGAESALRLADARGTLALSEAEQAEEILVLRESTLNQISDLEPQIAELEASLAVLEDRLDRLYISAPADGIVQSVSFPSPGEVIAPGETVFELLPSRQILIVEARIPNSDIGHITTDHPISVSVDTYDVRRFGTVEGDLVSFSPVPLLDEQTGQPYFRAAIELNRARVGHGAYERHLLAGMTVVAEIRTGQNTLLNYLIRPIHRTLSQAFSER